MEIVKSAAAKVNIGDYQSVDFFVSMKDTLAGTKGRPAPTSGEIALAASRLQQLCNELLLADLTAHFATRGKKYTADNVRKMFGIPKPQPEFG